MDASAEEITPDNHLNDDPAAAMRLRRGSFAVHAGLVDGRELLAVDRFAQSSLCWSSSNGRLRWGRNATDLADTTTELDLQAIFDYVYYHVIPSPRTIFRGIQRLPAGHMLVGGAGAVSVSAYWSPRFAPPSGRPDFNKLKEQFLGLLEQAVARQLQDGHAACYLSGGTDSSTVAGMIRRVTGLPPRAYSIGFEADGYDEMSYARIAARHFGVDHREHYVTPDDLVQAIPLVAAQYDQPFGNSSALPAFCCARKAHSEGISRLLAGDGGDELFGGNERYAKQRVFGHYDGAPRWLKALLEPSLLNPISEALPILRKGASYIRQARVPLPDRLQTYNLLNRLGAEQVFTPEFLAQVDPSGPAQAQRVVWEQAQAEDDLDRNLAFDWRYTLAENDLPKVVRTAAMAGVSVGFPLLDEALVDFSMNLPADYKLRGTYLRWFFKEALRGFLPDEIINKPKHGFGLPFGVWMQRHAGLKAMATDSLHGLASRGFIRADFARTLVEQLVNEHAAYYGEMIWVLMMLEQWLRAHRSEYRFHG